MVTLFIIYFHYFRYKYSCFYELDSLAVVNVRDLGGIKHTFKLLVFPEARLFQCANSEAKQVKKRLLFLNFRIHQGLPTVENRAVRLSTVVNLDGREFLSITRYSLRKISV